MIDRTRPRGRAPVGEGAFLVGAGRERLCDERFVFGRSGPLRVGGRLAQILDSVEQNIVPVTVAGAVVPTRESDTRAVMSRLSPRIWHIIRADAGAPAASPERV